MDPAERKELRKNQVKFVQDLEPWDVLDHLQADGILTENDYERISKGTSRKDRCQLLLSLLPTRGPLAYGSFRKALHSTKYKHLVQELTDLNLPVNQTMTKRVESESDEECGTKSTALSGVCSNCKPLLPSKWSNADLERLLGTHCCLFMQNIEPNDLIDYHYQENIISDDEYDRVRTGQTRKDRFITFLEEISKCPKEKVVSVLQRSLEKKYGYIAERIQDPNRDNTEEGLKTTIENRLYEHCHNCKGFEEINTRYLKGNVLNRGIQESQQQKVPQSLTRITSPSLTVHILGNDNGNKTLSINNASSCKEKKKMELSSAEGDRNCSSTTKRHHTKALTYEEHEVVPSNEQDHYTTTMCRAPFLKSLCLKLEALTEKGENRRSTSTKCTDEMMYIRDNGIKERYTSQHNGHISSENTVYPYDAWYTDPSNIHQNFKKKMRRPKTHKRGNKTSCNLSQHQSNCERSAICNWQLMPINVSKECLPSQPGSITPIRLPGKKLEVAFNSLSTLINTGQFEKFENLSCKLKCKFCFNPDMMCILGYLHASRDLFKTEFDSAKKHINKAFEIVPKTSNPKYFTVELFTAKTRMYITQKKLDKLEKTLQDAKMIIATDPVGCTGRAAGWLYMNDARNKTAQISTLNCSSRNFSNAYCSLHKSAKQSFERALVNFQQDGGMDGPFGFGYALCHLVILLLRCGENGLTMDILIPPDEDVTIAGKYLRQLEDSEVAIPKILELPFLLAKSDYQFRRGNIVRAMEYAQSAFSVETDLNLLEFTDHAHNRIVFLRTKNSNRIHEITEDEVSETLFNDESDSDDFSDWSFSSEC